jgi:hypothetical protein
MKKSERIHLLLCTTIFSEDRLDSTNCEVREKALVLVCSELLSPCMLYLVLNQYLTDGGS